MIKYLHNSGVRRSDNRISGQHICTQIKIYVSLFTKVVKINATICTTKKKLVILLRLFDTVFVFNICCKHFVVIDYVSLIPVYNNNK